MKGKVSKGSGNKIPHQQRVTFLDYDQTATPVWKCYEPTTRLHPKTEKYS